MPAMTSADPVALRQELALHEETADLRSPVFERFVIRLSERLDLDIPRKDYPLLTTVSGCFDYIGRGR